MNDIIVVGLIVALGLFFLSKLFSRPAQPPIVTYIPVIREPVQPQSSGCGPLLVAALILLVLFYLLGGG